VLIFEVREGGQNYFGLNSANCQCGKIWQNVFAPFYAFLRALEFRQNYWAGNYNNEKSISKW
jgi:hypothetical protein